MKMVDQTEAVTGGHAVRAVYMYAGMPDVGALTGDMAYVNALDRIWENVAGKKLHITGGIGARAAGESFGADYGAAVAVAAGRRRAAALDGANHF